MLVSACSRVSSRTFVATRPAKGNPIVAEHARVYAALPGWRLQHANPSCFKQIPKWNPKRETHHASNPDNTPDILAQHGRSIMCHVTIHLPTRKFARMQQSLHTEHAPTTHVIPNCPLKHPAADAWHVWIHASMAGTMVSDVSSQMGIPYSKQIDDFV